MSDKMTVLLVEPERHPKVIEMDKGLSALQETVGGYIECVYPFSDSVGLVLNEEGKLNGLPLNRALRDEGGHVYDIVAGPFLIVGVNEDSFCSLTPARQEKYEKLFHSPEVFTKLGREIIAIPVSDRDAARAEKAVQRQETAKLPPPKRDER